MTVYAVATTAAPEIVCPSWCETGIDVHLDDLSADSHSPAWDGRVLHSWWSHVDTGNGSSVDVHLGLTSLASGELDPHDADPVDLVIGGQDFTLAAAEALVSKIVELVAVGREYQLPNPPTHEDQL